MILHLITTRNILKLVLGCLIVYLIIFLMAMMTKMAGIVRMNWYPRARPLPRLQCSSVLTKMTQGKWVDLQHRASTSDMDKLQYFLHDARDQHFLPYDLQRTDRKCGNVTFELASSLMNNLLWFRALCNPNGDFPCCYNNHCEARPVDDCRCEDCYDLRQRVHAEFASWVPSDPTCRIHHFIGEEDTCLLLKDMTIYIIGDSFLRHLYISLLVLLRSKTYHGPLYRYSPQGIIQYCDRNFVHLRMCVKWIDRDTKECNNSVKLKFLEYVTAAQSPKMLEAVRELKETPNSLVIIGIGIHDDFNLTAVSNKLIHPLIKELPSFQWPKVLWASMHAPGLLKSPRIPSQNEESIARYNEKTKAILIKNGIPVFETFQLTSKAVSYDGAHFGHGINNVKAQIILNYILEQKLLHANAKEVK